MANNINGNGETGNSISQSIMAIRKEKQYGNEYENGINEIS